MVDKQSTRVDDSGVPQQVDFGRSEISGVPEVPHTLMELDRAAGEEVHSELRDGRQAEYSFGSVRSRCAGPSKEVPNEVAESSLR